MPRALPLASVLVAVGSLVLLSGACSSGEPTAATTPSASDATASDAPASDAAEPDGAADSADAAPDVAVDPFEGCTKDPGVGDAGVPLDDAGTEDPVGGPAAFTLAQALAGFPSGTGTLKAAITTEKGVITCTLDEANAPITVANFVGLARGVRPYVDKDTGLWTTGRFYDGLKWHRVIPDFVIQGGDPLGRGTGGPGYALPVENHVDEPKGTLAMAASTEPSGSQFYIVVGTGPAPEYNVFGSCTTDVAIAISEVDRGKNDGPKVPVHMERIEFARCP